MLDLETLAIRLTTEGDAELRTAMSSATNSVNVLSAAFMALIAVVSSVELWKHLIDQSVEAGEKMVLLSEKTGETVENLSRLQYAAKQAGTTNDDLSTGLKFLARSMQGVNLETGLAVKAFDAMGLKTKDARGEQKSLADMLVEVAGKFETYRDGPGKAALAIDLFGRSGLSMIPILNEGAKGIQELMKQADALGITMGTEEARKLKDYSDAMKKINDQWSALARELTVSLLPVLETVAGKIETIMRFFNTNAIQRNELAEDLKGISSQTLNRDLTNTSKAISDLRKELEQPMKGEQRDLLLGQLAGLTQRRAAILQAIADIKGATKGADDKVNAPTLLKGDDASVQKGIDDMMKHVAAAYDYELQLARDNYDAKKRLLTGQAEIVKTVYGTQSVEYLNMLTKIDALDEEHEKQQDEIANRTNQAKIAMLKQYGADYKREQEKIDADAIAEFRQFIAFNQQIENEYLKAKAQQAQDMSTLIANSIQSIFATAFSHGGNIGKVFQALGDTVMTALGGIFTRMGEAWLTYGLTMMPFVSALFTPEGGAFAAVAMGSALIALGATLGAIGGGSTGGSRGAASYAGIAPATLPNQGATRLIFGENSATTAAGMQPRQAVNVTVIGPNDPTAQRQITELIQRANRR